MSVDREVLAEALREAGVELGAVGGAQFRLHVADRLIASGVLSPEGETTTEYAGHSDDVGAFPLVGILNPADYAARHDMTLLSRTVTRTPWTVVEQESE